MTREIYFVALAAAWDEVHPNAEDQWGKLTVAGVADVFCTAIRITQGISWSQSRFEVSLLLQPAEIRPAGVNASGKISVANGESGKIRFSIPVSGEAHAGGAMGADFVPAHPCNVEDDD